jgi:uncharacterized protein YjdB
VRTALAAVALALLASCGGSDNGSGSIAGSDGGLPANDGGTAANDGGSYGNLTGISLSQTDVRIPAGQKTAFAVTGTYSDGTRGDVTQQANATSSNTSVATVEKGPGSQIQIHALAQGSSTITVTVGQFTQTCAVTVTP